MRSIEFLGEAVSANPYQGADAAKFAAMSPADQEWYSRGGQKPDLSDPYIAMRAPNKGAAVVKPAPTVDAGATDMSLGQAGAANAADTAAGATDMSLGRAGAANAATQTANGVNAAGQNVTMPGGINPETGKPTVTTAGTPAAPAKPTAPAANKAMTPAINAYASRMGLLTNNKPNVDAIKKFQTANGLKADGIIGDNTAGAILSAQKPGASNRGGPPRYKTPQEFDQEIARFSKTSNPSLPTNARYIATLQAEKAALAGAAPGQSATPAKPAAPLKPGLGSSPMRQNTFQESVDLMRRLSTMLKG
jgi:hypothetical protein